MTFDEAQRQMAEKRNGDGVITKVCEIGGLAQAIHYLYIVRNTTEGLSPEVIASRQGLMDISISLLRGRIKKVTREELIPLLEKWESI